jgi:hypothetical protein
LVRRATVVLVTNILALEQAAEFGPEATVIGCGEKSPLLAIT